MQHLDSQQQGHQITPGQAQQQQQQHPLHCGLLLGLNADLDKAFWSDERTLRCFTRLDLFACLFGLLGNILMFKAQSQALTQRSNLPLTWMVILTQLTHTCSCIATLAVLLWAPRVYRRQRHRISTINRLLRLTTMAITACTRTREGQLLVGSFIRYPHGERPQARTEAQVAMLSLTRPLFFSAMITMGSTDSILPMKTWLPLQLVTLFMACHDYLRFQPCRLMSDPYIPIIIQSACKSVGQLHASLLGLSLGARILSSPLGDWGEPAMCQDLLGAARLLAWYMQAAFVLVVASTAQWSLEWRLKARWAQKHLRKQLVYGPWGWPHSSMLLAIKHEGMSFHEVLQQWVSWLVALPGGLALVWYVCVLIVPLMPHSACQETCADYGNCRTLAPCEGLLCQDPGLCAAAVLYIQTLGMFFLRRMTVGHAEGRD